MKKVILTIGVASAMALGSLFFTACGGGEQHHEDASHEHQEQAYQCPMKCEGDKTYAEKGACPECGMDLAEVGHEH